MALIQFSGLASGIDSKALIDGLIQAREAVNASRKAEITYLQSSDDALEELRKKLLTLSDLVDGFRTVNGGGVKKKATSSTATVATAVAGSTAANASLTITVTALARTATGSVYNSLSTYTATTSVFDSTATGNGQVSILVGTGADQVTVTASDIGATTTLQDVVDKINADSDADGRLVATLVNVGTTSSPDYKIAFTGQKAGTELGTVAVSFSNLSGNITYDNSSPATNASFTIGGINGTVTRASNSVSDVIPGVTFQLLSAGSSTITVGDDADGTQDQISEMVDAFNDIVKYINENDEVTRTQNGIGATNVYGTLAKTNVDDDFLSFFRTQMSEATADAGTVVTTLAELGLSTNRDGTLTFDTDRFQTAIGQDGTGTGEVLRDFADSVGGISGTIYQFTKFAGFIDTAIGANDDTIDNLNEAIAQVERGSAMLRDNLEGQFARLESLTAALQSRQSALSGMISSLNAN